jgi:hypothetical protein
MMKRKNGSTKEQIQTIMETETYKSGSEFTLNDMLHKVPTIFCRHRMSIVLTEMQSQCLLDKRQENGLMRYQKPASRILRKRWISEMAETLCAGDHTGALAGQAARDAFRRARVFATTNQEACGDSL